MLSALFASYVLKCCDFDPLLKKMLKVNPMFREICSFDPITYGKYAF